MPDHKETSLDRTAERVLDALDRWSERLRGHHTQKRGQTRKIFRAKLTIYVLENEQDVGEAEDNTILETWLRNVSRSGACFVYPEMIKAEEVIICLDLGQGNCTYFRSSIIRHRQVHEGFWEYGVKFLERVNM